MSLKYEKIIKQMTLEEKARMMSGKNTWETVDFPGMAFRPCVCPMVLTDCADRQGQETILA